MAGVYNGFITSFTTIKGYILIRIPRHNPFLVLTIQFTKSNLMGQVKINRSLFEVIKLRLHPST